MSNTHVISIPDNFMQGWQVEEMLRDIHGGVSIIVAKYHYEALSAALIDAKKANVIVVADEGDEE